MHAGQLYACSVFLGLHCSCLCVSVHVWVASCLYATGHLNIWLAFQAPFSLSHFVSPCGLGYLIKELWEMNPFLYPSIPQNSLEAISLPHFKGLFSLYCLCPSCQTWLPADLMNPLALRRPLPFPKHLHLQRRQSSRSTEAISRWVILGTSRKRLSLEEFVARGSLCV